MGDELQDRSWYKFECETLLYGRYLKISQPHERNLGFCGIKLGGWGGERKDDLLPEGGTPASGSGEVTSQPGEWTREEDRPSYSPSEFEEEYEETIQTQNQNIIGEESLLYPGQIDHDVHAAIDVYSGPPCDHDEDCTGGMSCGQLYDQNGDVVIGVPKTCFEGSMCGLEINYGGVDTIVI